MPRTIPTLAAALTALALAAPAAHADPGLAPGTTSSPAGTTAPQAQDLRSPARHTTPADALAQERYYSSYGDPEPLTPPAVVHTADTADGIAPLPFILGIAGALLIGLAAGTGLHQLRDRRRHATGLAT